MEILSYNFPSKEEEEFIQKLLSLFEIIDITKTINNCPRGYFSKEKEKD